MPGKKADQHSNLHRNLLIAGLAGTVILTIAASLWVAARGDGDSMLPVYVGGGAATSLLLALLLFWWHQLLFGGMAESRQLLETQVEQLPPLASLKSWTGLYEQMVLYGGRRQVLEQKLAGTNWKLIEWFAWATLVTLFPIVNVWLHLFGALSQERFLQFVPQTLVVLCALMLVRSYMLLGGRKEDYQLELFRGLGLEPQPGAGSQQHYQGVFAGRQIEVHLNGRDSQTSVAVPAPAFELHSLAGAFAPPASLAKPLQEALALPKAKRWQDVQITGNRQGIHIQRRTRGQNMWLYDLWLAMRLAAALE